MEESRTVTSSLNKEAWFRYFARIIDITIGTMILGLGIGIILGLFLLILGIEMDILSQIPEYLFMIFTLLIYFIVEANVISSFGTTPGKKLFGITVYQADGNYLDYLTSIKRTFSVWLKGLALSLPIISFITLFMAYNRYTDHGITSWDEKYDVKVSFQPIGVFRQVIGISLWLIVLGINISAYWGN